MQSIANTHPDTDEDPTSDEPPQQTTFSKLSQLSQTLSANGQPADVAAPSPNGATVEGTVEHHEDVTN